MYTDPNMVRCHRITVRLSQYELDLITALANITGGQPGAIVRDLALEQATIALQPTATSMDQAAA